MSSSLASSFVCSFVRCSLVLSCTLCCTCNFQLTLVVCVFTRISLLLAGPSDLTLYTLSPTSSFSVLALIFQPQFGLRPLAHLVHSVMTLHDPVSSIRPRQIGRTKLYVCLPGGARTMQSISNPLLSERARVATVLVNICSRTPPLPFLKTIVSYFSFAVSLVVSASHSSSRR